MTKNPQQMNLQELLEQRDALEAQISAMRQGQRREVIAEIRRQMEAFEITVEDLTRKTRGPRSDKGVKRGPKNGA